MPKRNSRKGAKAQRKTRKQKPGRPSGSKTQPVPTIAAEPSRCLKCGSTERSHYFNRREVEINGVTPEGREYNLVVWRRTSCRKCGQVRDDRTYELVRRKQPKGRATKN